MRGFRFACLAGVAALTASLLLSRVHPFGDAHLYAAKTDRSSGFQQSSVPEAPRRILTAKCGDCHTMQTRAPFYGRLAPASWLMESDIVHAREAMNLDNWDKFSADQQQTFKSKIVQEVKRGGMPPPPFLLMHWDARIGDIDKQTLTDWARGSMVEDASAIPSAGSGDAAQGKVDFEKRCTGCHAMEQNREGPKLQGIVGRTSGTVPGYTYSEALKKAALHWEAGLLDKWLTDPDALVPGNNMEFHVSNAQERRDLIQFLEQSGAAQSSAAR